MKRQAFVAATYAAEEFAKAFLLWWSLTTGRDTRQALLRHDVKQGLAFALATVWVWDAAAFEAYMDHYSHKVAKLMTGAWKHPATLPDDDWEIERRNAIYEEESAFRLGEGDAVVTFAVADDLQRKVGKLIRVEPSAVGDLGAGLPLAFVDVFGLKEPFVGRVRQLLGLPTTE